MGSQPDHGADRGCNPSDPSSAAIGNSALVLAEIEACLARNRDLSDMIHHLLREDLISSGHVSMTQIEAQSGVAARVSPYPADTHEAPWSTEERARVHLTTRELASRFLGLDHVKELLGRAAREAREDTLYDYVADPGKVSGPGLRGMLERFCSVPDPEAQLDAATLEGTRVRLARLLLTDDQKILDAAKKYITIPDYLDIARRLITTNDGIGRVGGKMAGIIVASKILSLHGEEAAQFGLAPDPHPDFLPWTRPDSHMITAQDVFEAFMQHNQLTHFRDHKYKSVDEIRALREETLNTFRNAEFPPEIERQLIDFLGRIEGQGPFMVRSTSVLEDSTNAPFAGKYDSVVFVNQGSFERRLTDLKAAIAEVYASTYAPDAMAYRRALNEQFGLLDKEENMGVTLQRMVGVQLGKYFLPAFAGVGYSYNDDLWDAGHVAEQGAVSLVMGHGKAAVDLEADNQIRDVALSHPRARPLGSAAQEVMDSAQRYVFAVDLETGKFVRKDFFDLQSELQLPAEFQCVVSTKRRGALYPGVLEGPQYITFDGLVADERFVAKMEWALGRLRSALGEEVDIEFASDLNSLCMLQCRHQLSGKINGAVQLPAHVEESATLFSVQGESMLPTLQLKDIAYVVQVRPEAYSKLSMAQFGDVVNAIGYLNDHLPKKSFVLIGPGRWGTSWSDPWLGVPCGFAEISNCALLCEVIDTRKGRFEQPSFGTHWKNDLNVRGIKVMPLYLQRGSTHAGAALLSGPNHLAEFAPEFAHLSDIVQLIDVARAHAGAKLQVSSDRKSQRAIAWFE